MKLITALLSIAAFVFVPGAVFAMDPSSSGSTEVRRYPYPDWPAIAKTGTPPPKSEDQQKTEQNVSGNKGEPGLLEKAGQAIESITGRVLGTPPGTSQEDPSQIKASEANKAGGEKDMKAESTGDTSYPDSSTVSKPAESKQ